MYQFLKQQYRSKQWQFLTDIPLLAIQPVTLHVFIRIIFADLLFVFLPGYRTTDPRTPILNKPALLQQYSLPSKNILQDRFILHLLCISKCFLFIEK